jgi:hypothetical protein
VELGLDSHDAPTWQTPRVSDAALLITRNVPDRMLQDEGEPSPFGGEWVPGPILLLASALAIAFALRAWIWRRMGAQ